MADGTTAAGNLIITWPAFVTASGAAIAGGVTNVTLGANGALSVALVPNAGVTPAGVYYTVVYQLGPGAVKTEYWIVPTTSPVNLAGVRTTPGSGVAGQPVSIQYVNTALATKANDSAVVHLNGEETISGAKSFVTSPNVPAPTNSGDIANKGYVDQWVSNVGAGSYLPTTGGAMTGPITLAGPPSSPLQAATKQYVDLGLTSKADLVSGMVPATELGTGSATAANCLLGNGTWGPCGSGSGTGNVSTNPSTGVSQTITQPVGTQFSTNNLAGIPFVVSSYNWPQGGSTAESCVGGCSGGGLVAGTQATMTLTPCPAGIDTSNNSNAPYGVYISGTGTAEAVAVTGGSCTSGAASGTIVFTPGNSHAAGFAVGAANGGNQEAINVGIAGGSGHAVIQELPTGGANTANYNIYWPVFLKASQSVLNGDGAFWRCYTRSVCLMVGDYMGSTGLASIVRGLEFQSATNVDGAQISSVSASSGLYTINTASNHHLVTGDWVLFYYSTPAQTQEARVQVTVTSNTQFQYTLGATTFSSSTGFGWVGIENTAIEVETDGARLENIKYAAGSGGGLFHEGVVVGNDQSFKVDGMVNEGNASTFRCDSNFCSNMVYLRGDQGAAPVAYLHHIEASMQCSGNGIRNVAGNTLDVQDSVIQGNNQYAIYYAGGLQPWSMNNVYNESGPCMNPLYPSSLVASAGYIATGNALTIQNDAPIGGVLPMFVTGGGSGSQRNYYVVPKDSNLGTAPMMFIGMAQPATSSTNIPLYWPNPDLKGAGTRTFDIVVTTGITQTSAPYTGNAFSIMTGTSGNCNTAGVCTYTDTQSATTAYTVNNASWVPTLPFWPGAIILSNGASAYLNQCGQASSIISTSYLPKVFCKRGVMAGNANSYTPYWGVYPTGDSSGNGNNKVGAQVLQIGPASGSWSPGISGALNFNPGPADSMSPRQIITTMDGSPQQTFATPGYVRTGSAADSFIGTDTTGTLGTQDQTYGAPGGHNFYVNDAGTNSTHAKLNIGASSATLNVPLTVNGNLAVASGTLTLPITGTGAQCLHVSSTGVVTGTGSDCGSGGGGSGTVNSGSASQVAMYSGTGAAVSGDGSLTDSGTVLNYAGSGGISAAAGTFSGNLTVNGQLMVAGPWMVSSPIPGTLMTSAGAGSSALGMSSDGNFYISVNGGNPQQVATSATSSYFSNLSQEDANNVGESNGTTPQGLHVYGTYTNASNFERTGLGWDAADNYFVLRNENAGTGQQRGIGFWIGSGIRWAIDMQSAFKPFLTNTFDIGVVTPAQLVPRTIYAATSFDTLTQGRQNFELCNDATTGTALNFLAVYNSATPACAMKAGIANTDGVVGIVSNGSGTSGNAVITYRGYVPCSFDGSTVAGDYVVASTTNAADCHDAGAGRPAGVQVLGRVESTNSGAGTYGIRASLDSPVSAATGLADPGTSGIVVRNGVNTTIVRNLAPGSANVSITNPSGISGNPTIDVNTSNLFGSPGFTGTPTAPTAAPNTSSTQVATTAFVAGQMLPNNTANPWLTVTHSGSTSGNPFSATSGKASFYGIILQSPKTTSQVTYYVNAADNTANTYDIGIYSGTSGGTCTLLAHVGPLAGTSIAPTAATWMTKTWGPVTLAPGRYYLAVTSSATTGTFTTAVDNAAFTFSGAVGNVVVTAGGTLDASRTCPTDSYTTSTTFPVWAIN